MFFLHKYPLFWTTNVQLLFLLLNLRIFTPEQTKKIVFDREMIKIQLFAFYNLFTL